MEEIKIREDDGRHNNPGGYRANAGRPVGSKNLLSIPKKTIMEFTTTQELKNMVERAKKAAKKNDKMLQWYLEMCMGKPKVVEREGGGGTTNNIALFLDNLEKKNGSEIAQQVMENVPFVLNQGQETGEDYLSAE